MADISCNITSESSFVDDLQLKIQKQAEQIDDLEQYSRRNCLRVFGIPESDKEDTDEVIVTLAKNKLGVNIDQHDIDRSHRTGPKNGKSNRPRPIIVKFVSYRNRKIIITSRRKLKGSGISIQEDLTLNRRNLLAKAKQHPKTKSVWTVDGKVTVLVDRNGREVKLTILTDVDLNKI